MERGLYRHYEEKQKLYDELEQLKKQNQQKREGGDAIDFVDDEGDGSFEGSGPEEEEEK